MIRLMALLFRLMILYFSSYSYAPTFALGDFDSYPSPYIFTLLLIYIQVGIPPNPLPS